MELLLALSIGCLLSVQASVNLQLNKALGTPYAAASTQLGVATLALLVVGAAAGALGALGRLPDVTWWHLLGGLASPLYITSGILLFPRLGALLSVALFVTGQMFASLVLDLFGLLGVAQRELTTSIVLGAVAVLAGIAAIVRGQWAAGAVRHAGWLPLGLLAGAVLPVQGAVNAELRGDLGAPLAVALVSFAIATLTILLVTALLRVKPDVSGLRTVPWWGWLGGLCAAAYVTGTFLLLPALGAATTIALTVTGQQVASALIDHYGAFRLARRPLTGLRAGGLVLLLLGCALIQLGSVPIR